MDLVVTTTGSFPWETRVVQALDIEPSSVPVTIDQVIRTQIECNIDIIVDGQLRSDIVGIFANHIGLLGKGLPYKVRSAISNPQASITLPELQNAARIAQRPLKAHITGPIAIAESCQVTDEAPPHYQGSHGFRHLTLDLAAALACEAQWLGEQAAVLNIQVLQIDEPSLAYGANLELAADAIAIIAKAWRQASQRPVMLHVCGDTSYILTDLLTIPIEILSLADIYLREASEESLRLLRKSQKKLALGLIPVNTDKVPSPQRVARELLAAFDRYGRDLVWGITPNCGLRLHNMETATAAMRCLVTAADTVCSNRQTQEGE